MPNSLRAFMRQWRWALGICLVAGSLLLAAAAPARAGSPFWDRILSGLAHAEADPDRILAQQPQLIKNAVDGLAPQRAGVTDLYFVGLAGDSSEGVFPREVESVRKLFDARFGTQGRSLALVNSPQTIQTLPLATPDNLR